MQCSGKQKAESDCFTTLCSIAFATFGSLGYWNDQLQRQATSSPFNATVPLKPGLIHVTSMKSASCQKTFVSAGLTVATKLDDELPALPAGAELDELGAAEAVPAP